MRNKKPFAYGILFKIILLIVFFIPAYSQTPYDAADISKVVTTVLFNPLIVKFSFLLPIAKILLVCAIAVIFMFKKLFSRVFLGYYAFILIIVGLFQNISKTQEYGFAWLIGNTLIMFILSAFCIYDIAKEKSKFDRIYFQQRKLWVIAPMLLAFLYPYNINEQGIIKPAIGLLMITNESGLAYCTITPVIIGTMILFSKGIYKPILSIISSVGIYFGIINLSVWFIMQNQNWWMGVLHLPLFVLSLYALILCKYEQSEIAI